MEEFRRTNRELVCHGSIIDYYKDTVIVPNGNVAKWDFIGHKGAAAIVPVNEEGEILMVRQYRNSLDRYTIEIPAGGLNYKEEPTKEAAIRELEEETGFATDDAEFLMTIAPAVGYSSELIDVYVTKSLKKTKQHLDEDEFINVIPMKPEEIIQMIYRGEIQDSKTIAAVFAYQNKYQK